MEVTFSFQAKTLVVHLIGELDEHAAEYARRAIDNAIEGKSFSAVIFDLSRLAFMDSTGIGVLIGRYKLLRSKHCPVYVKNPSPTINKIFTMATFYIRSTVI